MKNITKQVEAEILDYDSRDVITKGTLKLTLIQLSNDLHPEIRGIFTIAGYIPEISDKTNYLRLPTGYEGDVLLSIISDPPPSKSSTTYNAMLQGNAWFQSLDWFDNLE